MPVSATAGGTSRGGLTYTQGVYLPTGWDTGWRAARAAAGSTPARLLAIGDSITQGTPAGASNPDTAYDWRSDAWFHKLVSGLLSKYSLADGAEFFMPLGEGIWNGVFPAYQTPLYTGTGGGPTGTGTGAEPFLQVSVTGRTITSNGWWRATHWTDLTVMSNAATALLKFNPPSGTKKITVASATLVSGGTYKYNVLGTPGTGDGTITLTANTDGRVQKDVIFNSGAALAQYVYFGTQSASAAMRINGILCEKTVGSGLQYGRLAQGGRSWGEFCQVLASLVPSDKIDGLFNTGQTGDTWTTTFPRNPDLTVLAMGTNDATNNVPGLCFGPEGYRAGLERTIQAIRRYNATASIAILLPWHATDFDDENNQVNNESWGAYCWAARNVAERWRCAFIDFQPIFGMTPVASGYVTTDAHPTRTGYTLVSNTLLGVL